MQTIRVALNDIKDISYTLTSPTINLWTAATPLVASVEMDVVDADTGVLKTTIPCTVTAPTTGVVTFSTEDLSDVRAVNLLWFRVTIGSKLQTIPTGSEQALWVY